jgi:hypothetical protein
MSEESYPMSQCLLEQTKEKHRVRKTVWVPTIKAKVGSKIKIKEIEGVWVVIEKYSTAPSNDVIENSMNYKKHRKATDI